MGTVTVIATDAVLEFTGLSIRGVARVLLLLLLRLRYGIYSQLALMGHLDLHGYCYHYGYRLCVTTVTTTVTVTAMVTVTDTVAVTENLIATGPRVYVAMQGYLHEPEL